MDKACQEAREGNLEYIRAIAAPDLQRFISRTDEDDRTLLHAAASGGSAALVNFLLEKGAAPTVNQADDEVRRVCQYVTVFIMFRIRYSAFHNSQCNRYNVQYGPPATVSCMKLVHACCRAGHLFTRPSAPAMIWLWSA